MQILENSPSNTEKTFRKVMANSYIFQRGERMLLTILYWWKCLFLPWTNPHLGQRGYSIILVTPEDALAALTNAAKFVWDWPSVACGRGLVSPTMEETLQV
jgi:hypothetical protein